MESNEPAPRLLVADNDPSILARCVEMLGVYFEVQTASSGVEAIHKLARMDSLAGVICDLDIEPGPDGSVVMSMARGLHASAFRLMVTTRHDTAVLPDAVRSTAHLWMSKPLRCQCVLDALLLGWSDDRPSLTEASQ